MDKYDVNKWELEIRETGSVKLKYDGFIILDIFQYREGENIIAKLHKVGGLSYNGLPIKTTKGKVSINN